MDRAMAHYTHMRLSEIRKAKGLRAADLADMIGVDPATVSRAESMHDSAKLSTYIKCADALGVTLSDIFSDDRTALESRLIAAFRALPASQHHRLVSLIELVESDPEP